MPPDLQRDTFVRAFDDPAVAARYADGPARFVPGLADLHRMTTLLLAERAPIDARILVLGAGGGLELAAMAEARPGWRFVGVDPAGEMLKEAARRLGPAADRVELCHGYIDDAPQGPFDGATCLLTLHFLDPEERVRTLTEMRRRLKPGAPLVAAHASFPQEESERPRWLARYAAFAVASGAEPEMAEKGRTAVETSLGVLPPETDAGIIAAAGFTDVQPFWSAFTWRAWLAYA